MKWKKLALLGVWISTSAAVVYLAAEDKRPMTDRPLFKVGVETVFVSVSVTDPMNRYVVGLEKDNFKVFEEKVEQSVVHFSQQAAPISVAVVLDVSGSMKSNNNLQSARAALNRFLQSSNSEDEFCLITFNTRVSLVKPFTSETNTIESEAALMQPGGRTALYDAVYRGLEEMKKAKNEKRALILITDGEDNSSRYNMQEVREFAKESNVQIYGIGEEGKLGYGRSEIQNIVALTGGRAFFPNSFNELDYYIDLIHSELRNQYLLGYVPSNKTHDGRWRRIKIRLDAPVGLPRLLVHSREGYYAPKQ